MPKKFKPGDWVILKGAAHAPKMEVLKYVDQGDSLPGTTTKDNYVACVYYKNGERLTKTVHQNRISKLRGDGGFYHLS